MTTQRRIEDYALLGNCRSAALVSTRGSIDWLCFPRFDSAACCAALLGTGEHGFWRIGPAGGGAATRRAYIDGTLVLETTFEKDGAAMTLVDCMVTTEGGVPRLVRLVRGTRGTFDVEMELALRFEYGSEVPWVERLEDGTWRAIAGAEMVVVHADVELRGVALRTVADFRVAAGDVVPFVLSWGPSHLPPPGRIDARRTVDRAIAAWSQWSGQYAGHGEYAHAVKRSLTTLKGLTYAPTGGIVAAATTSLPEEFGGARNWDYRFCWLRDTAFTLTALLSSGYHREAQAWSAWLLRAVAGSPDQVQIMYGVAGERRLTEQTIPWLPGFEDSKPVRIGNAASEQLQIDVFGEVMSTFHLARTGGVVEPPQGWQLQCALLAHLTQTWERPDQGIWETRSAPRHYVHSKVMAWVAFDRAIASAEQFGLDAPLDEWRGVREKIARQVHERGFDAQRNTFVRSYGATTTDASLLLLAPAGFLAPDDPRLLGTIAAIEADLRDGDLVRRYRDDDGVPGSEGAFLPCSFWLCDNYALTGRLDEARALFERLLNLRNDVGLLSEEYDVAHARQAGNVPQAFSHVALINSARLLAAHGARPAPQI